MFYIIFLLLCSTFSVLIESTLINAHKKKYQAKPENLFQEYMSSLLKLSDRFPDREIEFQLQFDVPEPPRHNPFKLNRLRAQNPQLRKVQRSDLKQQSTLTTAATMINSVGTQTTPTITTSQTQQADTNKVPIYLDDLKKAIEEFERKLDQQPDKFCQHHGHSHNQQPLNAASPNRIQDIMRLLGKGVNVQFNVPKPTNGDLKWLQVKIPNT